jgi:hypothetical protein
MQNIAYSIASILESEGVGTLGTDIFVGTMPESPDKCLATYDSGGSPPEPNLIHRPNVMIHVRGNKQGYESASDLVFTTYTTLHNLGNFRYNDWWYLLVWAASDPIWLGMDENNRPVFSINFNVKRVLDPT